MNGEPGCCLPSPQVPEPCSYCMRAAGRVREARRGFTCCLERRPVSTPPRFLGPLLLPAGERAGDPLPLVVQPAGVFASGMVESGSTKSISSSESLILLPLPTCSQSSATRTADHPPGHTSHCLSLLPCHSCQALALLGWLDVFMAVPSVSPHPFW